MKIMNGKDAEKILVNGFGQPVAKIKIESLKNASLCQSTEARANQNRSNIKPKKQSGVVLPEIFYCYASLWTESGWRWAPAAQDGIGYHESGRAALEKGIEWLKERAEL
ncbi:MAG: hypothetical protein CMH23_10555 [Methylophaga sp.]|uniref:hypothetical protein n=1 Tax=Methylophaga sp. TaxID=2024840 RepID=UPI000C8C8C99|nr:hypothetical protein [Methylophaga sp.]MBN46899.1 hypothetical protein [Methylophaga sp.]|tara:strand:- start:88 stop:414 length:327 start_codon:yes stop_codon:yes gene_type:complete